MASCHATIQTSGGGDPRTDTETMNNIMPSMFRRSVNVFRAAVNAAAEMPDRYNFAWHYNEISDSIIKIERGTEYTDSPKIRGAIAWALRCPGRQVTILKDGQVRFD